MYKRYPSVNRAYYGGPNVNIYKNSPSKISKKNLQTSRKAYYDPYPNYNSKGHRSYGIPTKIKNKYERDVV